MAAVELHLSGTIEYLEEWARLLEAAAEEEGLDGVASHARLVKAELKALKRLASWFPADTLKEKIRLLHMELNWIQNEIYPTH